MYFDTITLTAFTGVCTSMLAGGRIEDIIQPTEHSIALQCWANGHTFWLLASAHPQLARIQILNRKPQKMVAEPPPFVMLLRKHLEGARLTSITQPPWERILELTFTHPAPTSAGNMPVTFIIEIMGRISNFILVDTQRVILGSLRTIGPDLNRYRLIAPHHAYIPPPPQTRMLGGTTLPRLDPRTVTAADLAAAATDLLSATPASQDPDNVPAWRVLSGTIAGWSPLLSRETIFRAHGSITTSARTADWERISAQVRAFGQLPATGAWQPTLVSDATTGHPIAFAVYDLQQFDDAPRQTFASVNDLLNAYYRDDEWCDALETRKASLRHLLQSQRERCLKKDRLLRQELAALAEAHQLRIQAELLLAYQAEIPAGAREVTLNSFDPHGTPITITLDPQLSAVANANRLFARYHKLRRATEQIPTQIELNQLELAHLEQLATDLLLAETPTEIEQVRQEIAEAGYLHSQQPVSQTGKAHKKCKPAQRSNSGSPLKVRSSDQFVILIGKNSHQNAEVTFHLATGDDIWLHARGVPGAHVIIKSGGRPVPRRTLEEAAAYAAYYSQARGNTTVAVDYTRQRYVHHRKGSGPGMVLYEHETTLHVTPAPPTGHPAKTASAALVPPTREEDRK